MSPFMGWANHGQKRSTEASYQLVRINPCMRHNEVNYLNNFSFVWSKKTFVS